MRKNIVRVCGNIFLLLTLALNTLSVRAQIIITEVFPNPDTGTNEFVELYNSGSHPIDLNGWKIDDDLTSGRKPKDISGTIHPGEYLVFYFDQNFPYFNNTGTDSANLLDLSSQLINSVEYEKNPPRNLSYSLISNLWGWNTPTPGTENKTSESPQQTPPQQNAQKQNTKTETPDQLNGIIIIEVFPNPIGEDATLEFIELLNTNNYSVDLGGWQIDDADGGSHPYTLPLDTIVAPKTFIIFYSKDTKITLNNSGGDSVRLLRPDKSIADMIVYTDTAGEGLSYAKTEFGSWSWTEQPTPGGANIFEEKEKSIFATQNETSIYQKEPVITANTHAPTTSESEQSKLTKKEYLTQTNQENEQKIKPNKPIAAIVKPPHTTTKSRPNNIIYAIVISVIAGFISILIKRKIKK